MMSNEPDMMKAVAARARDVGVGHVKLAAQIRVLDLPDGGKRVWGVDVQTGAWRRLSLKVTGRKATARTRLRNERRLLIGWLNKVYPLPNQMLKS